MTTDEMRELIKLLTKYQRYTHDTRVFFPYYLTQTERHIIREHNHLVRKENHEPTLQISRIRKPL